MTPKEFRRAMRSKTAQELIGIVSTLEPAHRAAFKNAAVELYRQVDRFYGQGSGVAKDPGVLDADAAFVALVTTSTLPDVLKLKRIPVPIWGSASDLYAQLQPLWLEEALEKLLLPEDVLCLQALWTNGVCKPPACHNLVLGYFDIRQSDKLDECLLLDGLVWRFFTTQGRGAYTVSRHDSQAKRHFSLGYQENSQTWSDRLLGYSQAGKLNRTRLLKASLSAALAMEKPADIRWFSAFHKALAPTRHEQELHCDLYRLLARSEQPSRRALGNIFKISRSTV